MLFTDLAINTNDNPAVSCVCVVCVCCRSELSVEKTSVLQSELQSCTQLLELEPQNKCESLMCSILYILIFFYFHAALPLYIFFCLTFSTSHRVPVNYNPPDKSSGSFRSWERDAHSFSDAEGLVHFCIKSQIRFLIIPWEYNNMMLILW